MPRSMLGFIANEDSESSWMRHIIQVSAQVYVLASFEGLDGSGMDDGDLVRISKP